MADLTRAGAGPAGSGVKYEDLAGDGAAYAPMIALPGKCVTVTATVTRPSDTTAYAAGDQIADSTSAPTVITFSGAARKVGLGGTIREVEVIDSAAQTTKLSAELWLFDTPVTPNNDNAAWAPTDAEVNTVVAVIPLQTVYVANSTSGAGGSCVLASDLINRDFQTVGSSSLFGLLVARNAYTPVSGEVFKIRLKILQD